MKKKYVGIVIESYPCNQNEVLIASDATDNFIDDVWGETEN